MRLKHARERKDLSETRYWICLEELRDAMLQLEYQKDLKTILELNRFITFKSSQMEKILEEMEWI